MKSGGINWRMKAKLFELSTAIRREAMADTIVYADKPETVLRKSPNKSAKHVNHVLLGTWLKVVDEDGDWLSVEPRKAGKPGWVHNDDVRDTPVLKIFYVDVGQGDGAIIEHPDGILLIDGGPNKNMYKFMVHRYGPIFDEGKKMAQMKEQHKKADVWDSFTVPWKGKFEGS